MPIRLSQVSTAKRLNLTLIAGELENERPTLTNAAMRERLTLIRGEGMKQPTKTEAYNAGVLKVSDIIDDVEQTIAAIDGDVSVSHAVLAMNHHALLKGYRDMLEQHRYSSVVTAIDEMMHSEVGGNRMGIVGELRRLRTLLRSAKQDPT